VPAPGRSNAAGAHFGRNQLSLGKAGADSIQLDRVGTELLQWWHCVRVGPMALVARGLSITPPTELIERFLARPFGR
jgi:hypothetical protein